MWSIVSSCMLTLFACVYSAIHPNSPGPKDSRFRILVQRLGIMITALLAPELIVTWAMRQWLSAREITRQFETSYSNDLQPWREPDNTPRGFLVVLRECAQSVPMFLWHFPGALAKSVKAYFSEQSEDYTWTQTHSFFLLMGGFILYDADGNVGDYHTLQPDEVLWLIRGGYIVAPTLTANQINDQSKGNFISKGLIILQLEAGTLAFAVLNFLTYAVWWNKPLDVQCVHPVRWTQNSAQTGLNLVEHFIDDSPKRNAFAALKIVNPIFYPLLELISYRDIPTSRTLRVPTFDGCIRLKNSEKTALRFAGLLMATIFGGIHCMAWSFTFPTFVEKVLWRTSAVAIFFIPCLSLLTFLRLQARDTPVRVDIRIYVFYAMLYFAARAILLVLMFTTLRNLHADAYTALLWMSLVPHL
ncbi:hypothetical protein EDB19DRAFT_1833797 [Suillus lakei]|nr:hypothetical protein EDB19DRAFT_1833797 [Suillus lakei]